MPKCKHQGAPEHAAFCPWCGKKLIADRETVKVPSPRKLPSGTFFAQMTVGGQRVSISAPSEEEYFAKARAAKLGLLEMKKAAPRITVGAAIDEYIKNNSRVLSPSTIKAYKSYRKNRFQSIMEKDISSVNWQKAVNDECKDVGAKTIANAWRLITVSLAAKGASVPVVALPKIARVNRPWLDYEQITAFLAAVEGQDCEIAALLALHGLRRSELLHLTADDVDLDKGLIFVRGASVYDENGNFVSKDTNKNASSTRTVHIVIPRLKAILMGKTGVLVSTRPNTSYKQINRVCAAAGLPCVGVHGLRHSFASLAYHLGWSEASTMREGGWSNNKTVHDVYTHLSALDFNEDIKKMEAFYTQQKTHNTENRANEITNE